MLVKKVLMSSLLVSMMTIAGVASADVTFVKTTDGSTFKLDAALFDTPAAKEFLATGKNSYVGNAEAVAKGKKLFDKRQVKKTRDWNREKSRLLSKNNK